MKLSRMWLIRLVYLALCGWAVAYVVILLTRLGSFADRATGFKVAVVGAGLVVLVSVCGIFRPDVRRFAEGNYFYDFAPDMPDESTVTG